MRLFNLLNALIHHIDWTLVLQIVQIVFYVTTTIVGILAYIAAKNVLLNQVYNEYHKKVIDNLSSVSENLVKEFDLISPESWDNVDEKGKFIEQLMIVVRDMEEGGLDPETFKHLGAPITDGQFRMRALKERYKHDPFIPDSLRNAIVSYYERRLDGETKAHMAFVADYGEKMYNYKIGKTTKYPKIGPNDLQDQYIKFNVNISISEEMANNVRQEILEYFNSLNVIGR